MYRIACIIVTPDEMEVYLSIVLYPYVMHTKQKAAPLLMPLFAFLRSLSSDSFFDVVMK